MTSICQTFYCIIINGRCCSVSVVDFKQVFVDKVNISMLKVSLKALEQFVSVESCIYIDFENYIAY